MQTSENHRTAKGDELLSLCQTDPSHPVVRQWIADVRASRDSWAKYTDEEIVQWTIRALTENAKSRLVAS